MVPFGEQVIRLYLCSLHYYPSGLLESPLHTYCQEVLMKQVYGGHFPLAGWQGQSSLTSITLPGDGKPRLWLSEKRKSLSIIVTLLENSISEKTISL